MRAYKIDRTSLGLLGDSNWLSLITVFDLAGNETTQFMAEDSLTVPQTRWSRYAQHLHNKYISPYLRCYGGELADISVKSVLQGEDCSRNIPSISSERQQGWHDVCLIPDLYYFFERGYESFLPESASLPAWSDRRPVVIWRGSTTGVVVGADLHTMGFATITLAQLPRYRMCRLLQSLGDRADVGFVAVVQCPQEERDGVAAILSAQDLMQAYVSPSEMTAYKFLVDIDGNTNAWNFLKRLRMGCCILKVDSPWIQWIYHRIEPWVHYVPVNANLSDLLEKVDWCLTHDAEAEQIAENARRFALSVSFEAEMRQAALDILRTSTPLTGNPMHRAVLDEVCHAVPRLQAPWEAAIARWSSFPEPVRLKTAHGTFLGSDAPGTLIQIPADGDLTAAITLFDGEQRWRDTLHDLHIDRDGATLSLEREGLFLSAQDDRVSLACDRLLKGAWESFTLVPATR